MRFEWDPDKETKNRRKHFVDFREAASVFGDALSVTIPDRKNATRGDTRFITIGMSVRLRLLVVVEDRIRIISARHATKKNAYEEER
ncbi:BrnT family toxin [bacterium]|nr:BrnT family toxin [bacterium]